MKSSGHTVFRLTSSEYRDDGRLTRQFFRWMRDISAEVAWLLRLFEFESGTII